MLHKFALSKRNGHMIKIAMIKKSVKLLLSRTFPRILISENSRHQIFSQINILLFNKKKNLKNQKLKTKNIVFALDSISKSILLFITTFSFYISNHCVKRTNLCDAKHTSIDRLKLTRQAERYRYVFVCNVHV